MNERLNVQQSLLSGLIAGLLGGLALLFGAGQTLLPMLDRLMGSPSTVAALGLQLVFSAILGVVFAICFQRLLTSAGYSLAWGMAYALLWWIVGPLTLIPALAGTHPGWTIATAREAFPLLVGYEIGYGVVLGVGYWLVQRAWGWLRREGEQDSDVAQYLWRGIIIGGLAGLASGLVFSAWVIQTGQLNAFAALVHSQSEGVGRLVFLAGSFAIGAIYGLLFRRNIRSVGYSIAWGMTYGLLWWMVGGLTLLPLLLGQGLWWSLPDSQSAFSSLAANLSYGILLGVLYTIVDRLGEVFFGEAHPSEREAEGAGARGVRAVGMGLWAGALGGIVFAIVMTGQNALPEIARLVGSSSLVIGFIVLIVVSAVLGAIYGVLFRRATYTYGTALIWGLVYGLVLWLLGRLTIMPAWLGTGPLWTLNPALSVYPWLIGQLFYGAATALIYQYQARRHDISLQSTVRRRGIHFQRTHDTPTPALWAFILIMGILLPLLLAS